MPGGAIGLQWQLAPPCVYEYAESFGLIRDNRTRFNIMITCGKVCPRGKGKIWMHSVHAGYKMIIEGMNGLFSCVAHIKACEG